MFFGLFAFAILTFQASEEPDFDYIPERPFTTECSKLKSSSSKDAIQLTQISEYRGCTLESLSDDPYDIYVGGIAVTNYAFYDCQSISKVIIKDTVLTIGKGSFAECNKLTTVTFEKRSDPPASLSLDEGSFYKSSITEFQAIYPFISQIGKSCFAYCTNFAEKFKLNIQTRDKNAALTIGPYAFYESNIQLADNQIIQKGTTVRNNAFHNCKNIRTITFAGDVLEKEAFRGCTNLSLTFSHDSFLSVIGDSAFLDSGMTSSISVLPKYLSSIGPYAFYKTSVTGTPAFPDTLRTISDFAFAGTAITGRLDFKYVTTVGESAFEGTDISGELDLTNMKTIEPAAFKNTGVSGSLVIYPNLNDIKAYAFYNTQISGSLTIPSHTTIGDYAFANCPKLTENIKIEGKIKNNPYERPSEIGNNAFENLTFKNLEVSQVTIKEKSFVNAVISGSVNIKDSIVQKDAFLRANIGALSIKYPKDKDIIAVENYAFEDCQILSILLTDVSLGQDAFRGLSKATKPTLTFEHDILDNANGKGYIIGSAAFYDTPISGSLKILNTTGTVSEDAFAYCTNLTGDLELNASSINNGAFSYCQFAGQLIIDSNVNSILKDSTSSFKDEINTFTGCQFKSVILRNTGAIPKKTFYRMSTLSGTITIPKTIADIGEQAFQGCTDFSELVFEGDSSKLTIGERAFYKCTGIKNGFSISRSVEIIDQYAFYGCTGLTSVTLPNTLETINQNAFANSGIQGIIFPSSVSTIDKEAFSECSRLAGGLILPEALKRVEHRTFYNCKALTGSLTIGKDVYYIGEYAFYQCGLRGDLNLPTDVNSLTIMNGAFQGCSGLTGPLSLDKVTLLGYNAFYGCTGFTGPLVFYENLQKIPHHAFYQCTGLAGPITFPDTFSTGQKLTIDHNAFNGCTSLSGPLEFPSQLSSIGDHAFEGCSGLNSISFDSKGATSLDSLEIDTIGAYAFKGCSGLTGPLNLPTNGMTKIGDYAFQGCSGLNGPLFLYKVNLIGNYAFHGCSGFSNSLTISTDNTIIGRGAFKDCRGFKDGTLSVFIDTAIEDKTDEKARYAKYFRYGYFLRIGNEAFENTKFKNVYYSGRFEPDCDTDIGLSGKIKTSTEYANKTFCGNSVRGKGGLSGGAIAGIVIACIVVVAVIIFLIVFFLLKKSKDNSEGEVEMNNEP